MREFLSFVTYYSFSFSRQGQQSFSMLYYSCLFIQTQIMFFPELKKIKYLITFWFFFFKRKADCCLQPLMWVCLGSWQFDYLMFYYRWTLRACLEVLAGEHSYSYALDQRTLAGGQSQSTTQQSQSCRVRRDTHGMMREEGDTCLASQISPVSPGDQCGDRGGRQIPAHILPCNFLFLLPIKVFQDLPILDRYLQYVQAFFDNL